MPVYGVSAQWTPGEYDEAFHRLNAAIDAVATSTVDFLGVESWRSPDGTRGNAVDDWRTLEAPQAFGTHPAHLEAKRRCARWFAGHRVVVSEVLREYGDARMGAWAGATTRDASN